MQEELCFIGAVVMSTAFWNMVYYAQCFDNQIKNVRKEEEKKTEHIKGISLCT